MNTIKKSLKLLCNKFMNLHKDTIRDGRCVVPLRKEKLVLTEYLIEIDKIMCSMVNTKYLIIHNQHK